MMKFTAQPKRTFALVVGIAKYQYSSWNVKSGATVKDALKFANWLQKRNVLPDNIKLCLSPLEENLDEETQTLREQCKLPVQPADLQTLDNIITNFLSRKIGDLLYIFWAGHGLITSERERRLFCADLTKQNWQNIDLNSLLLLLSSYSFEIRNHICIIDACANYPLRSSKPPKNFNSKKFSSSEPRTDSQQFAFFATREGKKARISGEGGTGYFSQAVREALEQAPENIFPPDMKLITEQVTQRLEQLNKDQSPIYIYKQNWNGSKEYYYVGKTEQLDPDVCLDKFEKQLENNRRRRQATSSACELDIYVPLGLVERKHQPYADAKSITPDRGTELYKLPQEVIIRTYQYDDFLKEVIGDNSNIKSKNIAIIGEPGAGKTTLLEKIGMYLVEHQALPVFITLSNLSGYNLKEYLLSRWLDKPIKFEQLKELVREKRVWFLLDGVDEISNRALEALNLVSDFTSELTGTNFVVTCRLNVWDVNTKNLLNFQNYKTQDFSNEQVQHFISQYFECVSTTEEGEKLWKKLNELGRERLLNLVKNPLRLALMCQIWEFNSGADLPSTQAALYERFTRHHYEWKHREFPTTDAQQDNLNQALGRLALKAIDSEKILFLIEKSFVREMIRDDLLDLALKLGWLNQVDRDKDTSEPFYAFYHATFQEYFAALAINNWDFFLPRSHKNKPIEEKRYRIFEPQWRQVFLLWMGRQNIKKEDKEKFINKLVNFTDGCGGFYKYQAYFLASAAIVEFKDCTLASEIVSQIVKWCLGDFNYYKFWRITSFFKVCEDAAVALSQTNREKAVTCLVELIRSAQHEYIRREAVKALGKIDSGNPDAIKTLVELIRSTQNKYIRKETAEALGKIDPGNSDAIKTLVELIRSAQDDYTRSQTVFTLGEIGAGSQDVINTLVELIRSAQDDYTRPEAAEALGKIDPGNPDAIKTLVELIRSTQNELIRKKTAEALGKINPGNSYVINALVELIRNPQHELARSFATEALGKIDPGNPDAIKTLVELIRSTQDDGVRARAASDLGTIGAGNPDAINTLVELIGSAQDEYTLCLPALALSEIDPSNPDAIKALVELIHNSQYEFYRKLGAEALGKIDPGNQDAINTLVELTRSVQDKYTRAEAAEVLGEIGAGNQYAIKTLVELTCSVQDEYIRREAAKALTKTLKIDSMPYVVTRLKIHSKFSFYSYGVIWHCAKSLPYPEFYQAWHRWWWFNMKK